MEDVPGVRAEFPCGQPDSDVLLEGMQEQGHEKEEEGEAMTCEEQLSAAQCRCAANGLTHTKPEPPDTWERIEEDAAMQPYAYCVGNGLFGECDEIETTPTNELFARDLVRRCKALAGVSE